MSAALWGACLLSGAATLLFATLWICEVGLGHGGARASSVVRTALLAGVALGAGLGARHGDRLERPLVVFAGLAVGGSLLSLGLVLALPALDAGLVVAFALILLPGAAMGVSLPLLARALRPWSAGSGTALGRLLGFCLVGGALGALALETLLVPRLGLARTAGVAAALHLAAAVVALALDRRLGASADVEPATDEPSDLRAAAPGSHAVRLLAGAFVAGGILFGLERVWGRFLELFVFGTHFALALILATLLAAAGVGALAAAAWLRHRPEAARALAVLALLAGVATIATYAAFEPAHAPFGGEARRTLWLSLVLMLPTSLVGGVLLVLIGADLREVVSGDAAAAGWLTLAGALGASLGASLAERVLLPRLGVEQSLLALALACGLLALLLLRSRSGLPRPALYAAGGVFALVTLLFPFGLIDSRFVRHVTEAMASDGARAVAFREGDAAAAILLQTDWGGAPVFQQLVTNTRSTTTSVFYSRRHTKLSAYWPLVLRAEARRVLLVGYGLGNGAEAVQRAVGVQRIDVVEPSRTILGLSPLVARGGAPDPLGDARVRVHVEDGRSFLRAPAEPYDIISADPPPPQAADAGRFYSLEYFRLTRSRLAPGGIATHRMPVRQLPLAGTQAIVRAFCLAFEDCSLWSGAGYEWILAGSDGALRPSEAAFSRRWAERGSAADLRELGVERPEQLGALFLADAAQLAEWTAGEAPLVDDRPSRVGGGPATAADLAAYRAWLDAGACRERWRSSAATLRLWPPGLRERSLDWFAWQAVFNRDYEAASRPQALAELWAVLDETTLTTLPLLQLDSEPRIRAIARSRHVEGGVHPALAFHLGAAALADRDYAAAARFFAAAREEGHAFHSPRLLRALALGLAGQRADALAAVRAIHADSLPAHALPWRDWLEARLGRDAKGNEGP